MHTNLEITEQKHKTVEVGRDLWRSSSPAPLLKVGQTEQVTQDHVQMGFECLQGWRLCILSGQPVPVFDLSHSEQGFLSFRWSFQEFSGALCPITQVINEDVK